MFILSLAIADLIVGLIVMPISSAYVLTGDWIFGLIVCQFWLIIDYTASTASIFNLLILSLDRYWSIKSPLKYLCKRTKKRALGMIVVVWLLAACWIIPIIGWHHWYNFGNRKHVGTVCETEFSDDKIFKVTTSVVNFLIPMSLMVILYYKIYKEIKRRGKFDIGGSSSSHGGGGGGGHHLTGIKGSVSSASRLGEGLSMSRDDGQSSSLTPQSIHHFGNRCKSYRKTWSSKRTKWSTSTTNNDPRIISVCCPSVNVGLSSSSVDCSPSLVPSGLLKLSNQNIDRCSSSDTFTQEIVSEANCDLEIPIEIKQDGLTDYDNIHRYKQLIVLKAGNRAYSLEDYKDVDVQVEYIEPSNNCINNQSTVNSTNTTNTITANNNNSNIITNMNNITICSKNDSHDNSKYYHSNNEQSTSSSKMMMGRLKSKAAKLCHRSRGKSTSSPSTNVSLSSPNDVHLSSSISCDETDCSPSNGLGYKENSNNNNNLTTNRKIKKGLTNSVNGKSNCPKSKWTSNCRSKFQSSFSSGDKFISPSDYNNNNNNPTVNHKNGSSFNHHHHHHVINQQSTGDSHHVHVHGSFSQLSPSSFQSHRNVMRRVESSRLRQEKKAARQLGVILGAFMICWLPYIIVFIVTAYCSCINHFIHTMAIWLGYFNSTINPFLYALCNDNFKSAFRKMLARGASSKDQFNVNQQHGASFKYSQK
ncbi:putative uncharacterized protein DDB_G0277255 isoform X2 [Panonychus citri]|nr:putative uncharacterized protein DDB_G0277255 isoform X2 [Panonychus citri]XP_053203313.1 putative uncharacterized protein DDB_G0277255 isoform X2 [Panonychus citri]